MKFVKIRQGQHKGKRGVILEEEGEEVTIKIEGEKQPVKMKIDWVKVLGIVSTIMQIILQSLSKKR